MTSLYCLEGYGLITYRALYQRIFVLRCSLIFGVGRMVAYIAFQTMYENNNYDERTESLITG